MIRTIKLPTGIAALPPSVRSRLEDAPYPGTGVHYWIYSTALAMLNFISAEECVDLLHEHIPRMPKPPNEMRCRYSLRWMHGKVGNRSPVRDARIFQWMKTRHTRC